MLKDPIVCQAVGLTTIDVDAWGFISINLYYLCNVINFKAFCTEEGKMSVLSNPLMSVTFGGKGAMTLGEQGEMRVFLTLLSNPCSLMLVTLGRARGNEGVNNTFFQPTNGDFGESKGNEGVIQPTNVGNFGGRKGIYEGVIQVDSNPPGWWLLGTYKLFLNNDKQKFY